MLKPAQQSPLVTLGACLAIGTAVWIALLIHGALHVRSNPTISEYTVGLGPLDLHHITRQSTGEAMQITISVEQGLVTYLLLWICIATLISILLWRKRKVSRLN